MKQEKTVQQENKMGVQPIKKLLLTMSIPMMLSMLVQALYNVVDSVFVSRISDVNDYALRAVSLAFPVQSLMFSFAGGTAVGINAFISKSLGEKEYKRANDTAANGIFLEVMSFVLFFFVGLFFSRPFFQSQSPIPEVQEYGVTYLSICCMAGLGMFMQFTFDRMLQSTGKTHFSMYTQLGGAITNLIFDPLLIFGLGPFPKMGVAGAAIATVMGQWVAGGLAIFFHVKFNREVIVSFKGFKPQKALIKRIYAVGAPSIVMMSIGSVMTYGLNLILAAFGAAQTVFGIYFKLQSFIFMPVFGLNNGMVPIIAYNFGAGKKDRVIETLKTAIAYAMVIMVLGIAAMEIFPDKLIGFFNPTPELMAQGVPALRTICLSFLFAGYCIITGSMFQALGNGTYSMIISIARQLIVLLPAAYLLSLTGNVDMIWWAFPLAEFMSVAMTSIFLIRIYRKIIVHIGD
ncbi:MAG: MATE family efflux transporter [Lachnospiraceae bacterium]|nr:MATE family efflux transporter [Lachnospiraceae bacterium]